jgi:hypothetical protein
MRERAEAANRGPWEAALGSVRAPVYADGRTARVCHGPVPADAEFIAHARTDVPALVKGHEAVLEIHKPEYTSDQHGGGYYRCSADHWTLDDQTSSCPTVTAIETALGGAS